MPSRRAVAVIPCALAAIVAAIVLWSRGDERAGVAAPTRPPDGATNPATAGARGSVTAPPAPPATRGAVAVRRLDPTARQALAARIRAAREARERAAAARPPAPTATLAEPALPGAIAKDDIQSAMQALAPYLQECYEEAAPRLAIGGKLVAAFDLTGEPDVGTVVDVTALDGDPHITGDDELARCWRETITTLELPPLVEGGVVKVRYPFVLSTSPP